MAPSTWLFGRRVQVSGDGSGTGSAVYIVRSGNSVTLRSRE